MSLRTGLIRVAAETIAIRQVPIMAAKTVRETMFTSLMRLWTPSKRVSSASRAAPDVISFFIGGWYRGTSSPNCQNTETTRQSEF